jgi:DNA-binding NarL/FixJ family response regulator
MIKLLLVGNDLFIRHGLQMRLAREPDITIVGEANDYADILALIQIGCPDVVVIDQVRPDLDGMKATALLNDVCPGSAVIMLSLYDEEAVRAQALSAGVVAFVGKREGIPALLAAIRMVSNHC